MLPNLIFLYSPTRHKDLGGLGAHLSSEKLGQKYIVHFSLSYVFVFSQGLPANLAEGWFIFCWSSSVAGLFIEGNFVVLPILISFLCALTVLLYFSLEATSQYHLLCFTFRHLVSCKEDQCFHRAYGLTEWAFPFFFCKSKLYQNHCNFLLKEFDLFLISREVKS